MMKCFMWKSKSSKVRSKLKQWMRYRDVTRVEEQRAIQALERELAYMIDNYVVLSSTIIFFIPHEYFE